ncbi:hypothetical protein PVAP13_3NG163200 [Panicum virgatum]|uniref:Uncharacterized protein n=1 Tax=Panicum virgatum TaxID=38727 RepID=A0A8T0UH66_PANVG|nr:hypothetical protein PVAP13_3NG163200 [Panicum virgatum]
MKGGSSRSSGWSASSRGRGGGEMERFRSPVPYRVGPYDYSPAVKCRCNRKKPGDCGYYVWMDREATQCERILMCDLRDAVWQLRREKEEEQQHVQRIQEENGELR